MKNKCLFIVATHGNEGFSVDVLKKLGKKYPKEEFGWDWIIGNEKAYRNNTRFTDKDLNRSAPGNKNSKHYEDQRASEIIELSKKYDFVIDIHGTKSDFGVVSIITYPTFPNLVLSSMFNLKNNVIWYASESSKKGPLTQYVNCPGIELECGPKDKDKTASQLYDVLGKFLARKKSIDIGTVLKSSQEQSFYAVYDKLNSSPLPLKDFKKVTLNKESFYPFMSKSEYKGISCYKMKKIDFLPFFIY